MSNNSGVTLTPDGIRRIAAMEGNDEPPVELPLFKVHRLESRLDLNAVADAVNRYEAGEGATALAKELGVAPSALLRLLRERNVIVRRQGLTTEQEATLAREYKAGATMAELEAKHQLSHGVVLRALHRSGVAMRAKAPRKKSV